jgi:hypothetical protein
LRLEASELQEARSLPIALEQRLQAADAAVRAAAGEVSRAFAENLGYLIAALKRGDRINRSAREDWDESYWQHWSRIRTLRLGGGLVAGALGESLEGHIRRVLEATAVKDCDVRVARHAAILPLIGAARCARGEGQPTLVFDFGQSLVKSAIATYRNGSLQALDVYPSLPAAPDSPDLAESMAAVIAAALAGASIAASRGPAQVVISLASYVRNNHPLSYTHSGYARLHSLTDNLGAWLADRAARLAGVTCTVELMHDGTAAAQTYAGEPETAVIMLGTALGSGFASLRRRARPLANDFAVRTAE